MKRLAFRPRRHTPLQVQEAEHHLLAHEAGDAQAEAEDDAAGENDQQLHGVTPQSPTT